MLYQSHFRGEYVSMNKRGRRRMLLVLLLPWQAFGNIRNRSIGLLVSVIRTIGSAGSRRKIQNKKSLGTTMGPSGLTLIIRFDMNAHEAKHAMILDSWHPLVHLA